MNNITYELAKQLKEAGFPQGNQIKNGLTGSVPVKYPTLSELIKACRENLDEIVIYVTEESVEVKGVNPTYGLNLSVTGSTLEEAVANLYLAINKK